MANLETSSTEDLYLNGADQIGTEDAEDLQGIYISQDHATDEFEVGVSSISVGRPPKYTIFRINPNPEYQKLVLLFETEVDKSMFFVDATLRGQLKGVAHVYRIFLGITNVGTLFLLPVRVPDESGELNQWHASRRRMVSLAMKRWIQMRPVKASSGYRPYYPKQQIAEPEWPTISMDEIVANAVIGKRIQSLDHPALAAVMQVVEGSDQDR